MSIGRRTPRMDITIATPGRDRYIFVQQRWLYSWVHESGTLPWTATEQRVFHNRADQVIWGDWSSRFILKTTGTSLFAKSHKDDHFRVNFDIMKVPSNPHWRVRVTKASPAREAISSVTWGTQLIQLHPEDIYARSLAKTSDGNDIMQFVVSHEFGHAVGNSRNAPSITHGDEYGPEFNGRANQFDTDLESIMHIGNRLRQRHLDYLLLELNKMVKDTSFYIHQLR